MTRISASRQKCSEFSEIAGERKKRLLAFQRSCGIKFKSLGLLNLAFVHRSMPNETGGSSFKQNNERLEFLGDAILGAVTAALLYEAYPEKTEGEIAKIKSIVVSAETLSGIARQLEIDNLMLLGHGEELTGGRTKKTLLADTIEALFGALYMDSGFKSAFKFIKTCIAPEIERVKDNRGFKDYKSVFQEMCQKRFHTYPKYKLIKQTGPEHEHYFWVEVHIDGKVFGPGTGKNKKSAEQEAAKMALKNLEEC